MTIADSTAIRRWINQLAAVLSGLAVALPAVSQPGEPRSPSGAGFVEVVNVEVVNVDVYVTDSEGKPVLGLGPEDFELRVDGRPVPISNFYAVEQQGDDLLVRRGGELTAEPLSPPPPEDPLAREAAARQPAAVPPEQALHVVIYIDNLNLTPPNRNRVMRELRAFIREHLRPEDRIMLASFDRYLNLRMPFTNDRNLVWRALLELEELTGQRVHRNSERRDLFEVINDVNTEIENRTDSERRIEAARRGGLIGGGAALAREQLINYAGSVRNETNMAIDGLMRLVENLSAAPGRKAIVYVADGIPMIAAEDIFYFLHGVYEQAVSLIEMTEYDMSRRFQQLAASANANRASFYAIDARGLTVYSQGTVDSQVAGLPGQMAQIDTIARTNLQSPLQLMAEETGGRAIVNANRVMPELLRIAADFRNYYALGYMPDLAGEGAYHRIEVIWKNKPRGAEVRHRNGYRDKTLESRMIEGTLSALNLNMLENPLGVRLHNLPPKRRPDGNYDVPLVIEVAWEDLTLIPRNGVHHGRIQLWMAARDDKDHSTAPQRTELNIAVPEDRLAEIEGATWRYGLELTMESGYHDLGIGLRDDVGGRQSFLRGGVNVR
ncbi:MAG: VWA domain-containing protein [Acidobacteria bacterium]|nr:VWA domain-containing protein [Acidobacteriota bacterium]